MVVGGTLDAQAAVEQVRRWREDSNRYRAGYRKAMNSSVLNSLITADDPERKAYLRKKYLQEKLDRRQLASYRRVTDRAKGWFVRWVIGMIALASIGFTIFTLRWVLWLIVG
jgi:hypothetical protein